MPSRTWTPGKIARREADNAKLLDRVVAPVEGQPKRCWVSDCGRPSGAATPGQLGRFCKAHAAHYRRHGSPLRPSYAGPEVNPYRRAALSWLRANRDDNFVGLSLGRLELRYLNAGQALDAYERRARGLTTGQKADAVWAALRQHEVDPLFVLAAIVGVTLAFEADPQQPSGAWGNEYRRAQIAKVLMRMAGGEVSRWAKQPIVADLITGRTERPPPRELRAFPHSSGRVLRVVGQQAEDVGEFVTWQCLDAIRDHAAALPITKASRKTPWPDRQRAKPKPRVPEEVRPTGSYATQAALRKQRQRQREAEREARRLASIVTPEQEAARQPTERTLRNGRWEGGSADGSGTPS